MKRNCVTRETGFLSRVPKHPVCPLPHLLCCSIFRKPVPVVLSVSYEVIPPFILKAALY